MYCLELTQSEPCSIVRARPLIVHQLSQRILDLHEQIAEVTKLLGQQVRQSQTPLLEMSGIGSAGSELAVVIESARNRSELYFVTDTVGSGD